MTTYVKTIAYMSKKCWNVNNDIISQHEKPPRVITSMLLSGEGLSLF